MVDYTTVFVSGEVFWAKVFQPVANYEGTAKEWALDFAPDDTTFLKEAKLLDRLKDAKNPITKDFIRLKKPEKDKDGNLNEPIRIYDADNAQWDSSKKIGNGSRADIKLTIADFGKGKKKAIWVKAIRITDLVPYVSDEFSGMSSPAPKPKTKTKVELEDLDDDIPF